jgi:hypothetical protein
VPYNVNPPCLTGQKTKIDWQFPGQTTKTNDQGDDYRILDFSKGQCVGVNKSVTVTVALYNRASAGVYSPAVGVNGQHIQSTTFGISNRLIYPQSPPFDFSGPYSTTFGNGEGYSEGFYLLLVSATGVRSRSSQLFFGARIFGSLFKESTVTLTVVNLNGQPDNCGYYRLDIYKNGQIIATDTGNLPPSVSHQCITPNQCPPNTCEVDCGTYVCCYGSDGISVFNYNK